MGKDGKTRVLPRLSEGLNRKGAKLLYSLTPAITAHSPFHSLYPVTSHASPPKNETAQQTGYTLKKEFTFFQHLKFPILEAWVWPPSCS